MFLPDGSVIRVVVFGKAMSSVTMAARIEAAVAKELPTYARARDLEDDTKTMCFEEPKARRLLRIELGRAPSTIWMVAFNYDERPTRSELLDRAAPNHKLRSVAVGPFVVHGKSDYDRLTRWIRHYSENAELIDFGDPFNERFLSSFPLDVADRVLATQTALRLLSDRILAMRSDTAVSKIALPFGTLSIVQEPGYVSTHGKVDPYARLVLVERPTAPAWDWLQPNTASFIPGFYMSGSARNQLLAELLHEFEVGDRAELAENGEVRISLTRRGEKLRVDVSKAYVVHLNRDRPGFVKLIESLGDEEWKGVYEREAVSKNPTAVLFGNLAKAPTDFAGYKAIADYYAGQNDHAMANLYLALGYMRAKRLTSVARGKLEIAKSMNPRCDGLAEAFTELESLTASK